jgi:peptide-methionine (R)-S-oxide reductase
VFLHRSRLLRNATLVAFVTTGFVGATACLGSSPTASSSASASGIPTTIEASHLKGVDTDKVDWKAKTAEWWQQTLPPKVNEVCRNAGTERPWSGDLLDEKHKGTFVCSSCGQELFASDAKFESGTGWPSFYEGVSKGAIKEIQDTSHGMVRTEVRCGRCDAHLGHVFPDGPKPTGMRYCINSVCLLHVPK